jgi:hypothetical protein
LKRGGRTEVSSSPNLKTIQFARRSFLLKIGWI